MKQQASSEALSLQVAEQASQLVNIERAKISSDINGQALSVKVNELLRKYGRIIDIETELERFRQEAERQKRLIADQTKSDIKQLRARVSLLQSQVDNLDRRSHELHETVSKHKLELAEVEESLIPSDAGLYKPHFEWNDSAKY